MPKFLFNLETLRRHREELEERARDELLRISYQYQVELASRDALKGKFQETMNELSLKRAENAGNQELHLFYLYLNRLTKEIEESTRRLLRLETAVQAQRKVVIEASKKRKTLDLMKAKKERQFAFALEKQEQKEVDELVATRFGPKQPVSERSAEIQKGLAESKEDG